MNICLEKEDIRRAIYGFEKHLADNFSDYAITKCMTKSELLVVALYYFQKYQAMGFGFENEEAISHNVFTFQNFIRDKYPLDLMTRLMSKEELLGVAMYYFNKNQVQLYSVELINQEEVLI